MVEPCQFAIFGVVLSVYVILILWHSNAGAVVPFFKPSITL